MSYDLVKGVLFEQTTYCPVCGAVLSRYTDEVFDSDMIYVKSDRVVIHLLECELFLNNNRNKLAIAVLIAVGYPTVVKHMISGRGSYELTFGGVKLIFNLVPNPPADPDLRGVS
mgnify:FL=1